MHYTFTPLHHHIDLGLGATGEAFKEAADRLEASLQGGTGLPNASLPILFLRRHCIELFLKSAIVIIHCQLTLPYGGDAAPLPHVLVDGRWCPFYRVHSCKDLWRYAKALFAEHATALNAIAEHASPFEAVPRSVEWTFPADVDDWIEEIEVRDRSSTFLRYPNFKDPTLDAAKSSMVEAFPEEMAARLTFNTRAPFTLLVEGPEGDLQHAYYYSGDQLAAFAEALKACADLFYGTHVALRVAVCGGA